MSVATTKLDSERQRLHRSWAQLDLLASLYLELARFIDESWPRILRPAFLQLWLQSVTEYAQTVKSVQDSVEWLNRANRLVEEGKAEYRESQTVPGDLDLWADPEEIGPMPDRLIESFAALPAGSSTLGIEPLSTAAVVLIAIGIIGATGSIVAVSVAVIEHTKTRRAEIRANLTTVIVRSVEAGAISESLGKRMLETIDVWTQAEADKPLIRVDTSGVLTVAALGGIGYGLYRLFSKPRK